MVEGLSLDLSKGTSIHVEHKVIEKLETINSLLGAKHQPQGGGEGGGGDG